MVFISATVYFMNTASSAARFEPSLGNSLSIRKIKALDHILERFCRGVSIKCIKKRVLVTIDAYLALCLLGGVFMAL